MRKRRCRHKSVDDDDDMFPDLEYAEKDDDIQNCESDLRFEIPNYLVDEDVIVVDTDDIGEFTGSKSLSICNFPCISSGNHISIFHSEWSKIPCSCDILKNDGDAVDEQVAKMPLSLHEISSNDGHEPIPISIVLPDGGGGGGGSSLLLQTCSLASRGNEKNHGPEISPIPLTKTLEGTSSSRPWSVCSSLTPLKNLPLMEDSSGACNSLDEQSCGKNVSSSGDKDAESAQTPSILYQDVLDGEDEICFPDVDAMVNPYLLLFI